MTTVQEFVTVKLAATYNLPLEQAREIVADEVWGWRRASIPLGWAWDITQAPRFLKQLAWYAAEQNYKKRNKS